MSTINGKISSLVIRCKWAINLIKNILPSLIKCPAILSCHNFLNLCLYFSRIDLGILNNISGFSLNEYYACIMHTIHFMAVKAFILGWAKEKNTQVIKLFSFFFSLYFLYFNIVTKSNDVLFVLYSFSCQVWVP